MAALSRVCTACKQEKPLAGFYRHPTGPHGRACKCIPCSKKVNAASYRKNALTRREKMREWKRAWSRKVGRKEQFKLPQAFSELDVGRGWRTSSKQYARIRERLRYELDERYKAANTEKANRRRTCRVPWADKEKISKIYLKARLLTKETGVKHVVDHIVPIKHPLVCGLHVENNLKVMTYLENGTKKNKFEVAV